MMANSSPIWHYAAYTTNQFLPAAKQDLYKKKSLSLNKTHWRIFLEKVRRRVNKKRTRQKEQQDSAEEQARRQKMGPKWQPRDSTKEGDIRHPPPPLGGFAVQVTRLYWTYSVVTLIRMRTQTFTCRSLCLGWMSWMIRVGTHSSKEPLPHIQISRVWSSWISCRQYTSLLYTCATVGKQMKRIFSGELNF